MNHPDNFLPLREPTFFILLSLTGSEKHGYAIMKTVLNISDGRVRLTTGTLYEALARLLEQGLVERLPEQDGGPGRPRKSYRLKLLGRKVLEAEAARLRLLSAAAQRHLEGSAA